MILTDTHAHLYAEQFDKDRKEMIDRAKKLGVERIFLPNIDLESYKGMIGLKDAFPNNCYPMLGLHPCSVQENYMEVLDELKLNLQTEKFYGIGEIGLDLHWDKSTLDHQIQALKIQIEWAKENNLPVILHCREAYNELLAVLEEVNDDKLFGIFHCFTGTLEEAKRIIDLGGFKLGIGGIVTFKNAGLAEVVQDIELKHIVLETDSPYLAPHPYRGKRNESSYLLEIAQKIADVKQVMVEKIAEETTLNSKEIFKV